MRSRGRSSTRPLLLHLQGRSANRHRQRGFAGLLLAVLFLLLLALPMLYFQSSRIDEQRAQDRAIKRMLTQPAPPPLRPPASAPQ